MQAGRKQQPHWHPKCTAAIFAQPLPQHSLQMEAQNACQSNVWRQKEREILLRRCSTDTLHATYTAAPPRTAAPSSVPGTQGDCTSAQSSCDTLLLRMERSPATHPRCVQTSNCHSGGSPDKDPTLRTDWGGYSILVSHSETQPHLIPLGSADWHLVLELLQTTAVL